MGALLANAQGFVRNIDGGEAREGRGDGCWASVLIKGVNRNLQHMPLLV